MFTYQKQQQSQKLYANLISGILFFSSLIVFFSCKNSSDEIYKDEKITQLLLSYDIKLKASKFKEVNASLDSLRPYISDNDLENLNKFFQQKFYAGNYASDKWMHLYADSALAVFDTENLQQKYNALYIQSLMLKGDAYIQSGKNEEAINYYFDVKERLNKFNDTVSYCNLLSSLANLYFTQKKYNFSAQYQLEANAAILNSKNVPVATFFHIVQSTYNNAGFSYFKAKMYDSALIYYTKNYEFIREAALKHQLNITQVNEAKVAVLDNLGGLYEAKGEYENAIQYLREAVTAGDSLMDSKASVFVKLAQVSIYLKRPDDAEKYLLTANTISFKGNKESEGPYLRLLQTESNLYAYKKDYKKSKYYLEKYIKANDSIQLKNLNTYSTNPNNIFQILATQMNIKNLEQLNNRKTFYIVGASLLVAMLVVIVLLTVKNSKQAKKVKAQTELQNAKLEETLLKLEERNKDYIKIMRAMAHDLRNPLAGIVGITRLMLDEKHLTESDKEMLKLVESSGVNSIEMISQLLNSGFVVENEAVQKEQTDINELLKQCVDLLQYKAAEKQQKINYETVGEAILTVSKEKIWRVFNNLIVNAIKFSKEDKTIRVKLTKSNNGNILVAVADEGIGIPERDRTKIFDMFTAAKRPGTSGEQPFGLGLSISKQIIESHNGKIWFEDNPTGGTIFYVELPK